MKAGMLVPGSGGKQQSSQDLRKAGELVVTSFPTIDSSDLSLAADILEAAALLSVRSLQVAQFESFLSLLTAFDDLPPSSLHPKLIALQLLLLLSRNQIGAFHTMLERLTANEPEVIEANEVAYVVEMERCLMEGSYSKVWQVRRRLPVLSGVLIEIVAQKRSKPPMQEFVPFLEDLMTTIRCVAFASIFWAVH